MDAPIVAPLARDILVVNVAQVIGPFVANILNWMLMGTLIMQLYTYYQKFSDGIGLRVLVYSVVSIDIAQTFILTQHGWWFIITIWGQPEMFDELVWSGDVIPFTCRLVAVIVQILNVWQSLTSSRYMHAVAVLIVLLALTQGITAMVASMLCEVSPFQETLIRLHPEFTVWLAGSFVDDIIITVCITYILSQVKTHTSWSASETTLTKVINRVMQTGAATVTVAAIDLALFVSFPTTNYHFIP
ncbi:hypothetical protein DFH07DRAFT_970393 [Mycena maculata]|uniref:Uncharacterized protein n=1 Tax=Mycena maculata TaxID=230809 RepID=A0AAD7HSY3_9AGAR|nr:hypothetical protein DFH07DRAFT_970393 [Mycena maculata]